MSENEEKPDKPPDVIKVTIHVTVERLANRQPDDKELYFKQFCELIGASITAGCQRPRLHPMG